MSGGGDSGWRPSTRTDQPTESVPGYDDLVEIGRGGDSVVYRARQAGLGRDVAIKVLLVDDEPRAARFAREVQITIELGRQHPNIVNVLATGVTDNGHPCIVMDYYPGGTLHDRLKAHGPLPVDEVVSLGVVLADALAFAHDRGVLHRDVKPQNVLVLPTSWVLADFGIARLADSEHTSSVETFTYRHAAPQVLDGLPPTAADDLWSLGSTLFTLIDGRPPFASDDPSDDTALAYLRRARTEPHRRLTTPNSERVAAIIDRCLAKDVADRWASAAELRDALAGARTTAWLPPGDEATASPAPVPPAPVPPAAARAATAEAPEPPPARQPAADSSDEVVWAPADSTRRRPEPTSGDPAPPPPAAAEPEPVALSVLAHAPVPAVDAAPTGTGLEPLVVPDAPAAARTTPEMHGHAGRRSLMTLGVVALVVGLVLGVGGVLLRNQDDPGSAAATPTDGAPIGSLTAEPTQTGDVQVPKADPRLRFLIKTLRFDGAGIYLEWTDPSDGEGYFVLHQTLPGPEHPLARFDPGQTSTVWSLVARPGTRYCFAMTVHLPTGEIGAAQVRCLKV